MPFNQKNLYIVCAIVVVVIVGFMWGFGGDERAVKSQLGALVELVEKDGPVSQFDALGRSRKFKTMFVEDALIEYLPGRSLPRGTDVMQSGFLSVWGQIESASIRISKHEVDVKEGGLEAMSTFYANCRVIMNGAEQMGDTVQYRAYWVKPDGDWLIERIVAESR